MRARAFVISMLTVTAVLFVPRAALATETRRIEAHPPVGSSGGAAYLNQGWHSTTGLDWDDEDGSGTCCNTGRNVYLRIWAYRSGGTSFKVIAYAQSYPSNTSTCVRARARIRNKENGIIVGYLDYNHAVDDGAGYQSDISANASGGYSAGGYLNVLTASIQTAQSSWETCAWTGPHVHAYHANGASSWTRNTTNYPGSGAGGLYNDPITAPWERKISWSY